MDLTYGAPQSRNEAILQNMLGENNEILPPESRIEVLLQLLLEQGGGGGGGNSSTIVSELLTLTVAGWDAETKRQTVAIAIDTDARIEVDITWGEQATWNSCGVYPVAVTENGITFEAATIPVEALTFKVVQTILGDLSAWTPDNPYTEEPNNAE